MKTIAFIGAGLIGKERIKAYAALRAAGMKVTAVGLVDPYSPRASSIAESISAPLFPDVESVIRLKPDLLVIAVPHDSAVDLTATALQSGIRVLVEKPMGRNLTEATKLASMQTYAHQLIVGHNYRFFEGVSALFKDLRSGIFGSPISLSFLLGHGGSPDDLKGWKLDAIHAGGGCLIDPGIHLLDLVCQAEESVPAVIGGNYWNGFWNTGIEEDCHLIFRGSKIPSITVDVSIVRWRSTFRIELFGTDGYGIVEGRGRSYGPQIYRRGRRWGWRGGGSQIESEELVVTTSGENAFTDELRAALEPNDERWPKVASAEQALEAMQMLSTCRNALDLSDALPDTQME